MTKEFLARIKSGEATTQDLKAACDWLKTNDISGVAYDGNPLDKLTKVLPTIDPEMVQQRLYGSKEKALILVKLPGSIVRTKLLTVKN